MPGYLITPTAEAASIPFTASGNITANNLQDALTQIDSNNSSLSASVSSLDSSVTSVSASVSSVQDSISSVEGVALLGL